MLEGDSLANVRRVLFALNRAGDYSLLLKQLELDFQHLKIEPVATLDDFLLSLRAGYIHLAIVDHPLGWHSYSAVLEDLRKSYPECPAVVLAPPEQGRLPEEILNGGWNDVVVKTSPESGSFSSAVHSAIKRAESKRKADRVQSRLAALLNQLNLGVFRAALEGSVLEGNAAFLRLLGMNAFAGSDALNIHEIFANREDRQRILRDMEQNGQVRDYEVQLRRMDGSLLWVSLTEALQLSPSGAHVTEGLMEDISGRKKVEEQLQKAEAKYRSLVEKVPGIVYLAEFGTEGRWHYVSPQIQSILGFSVNEWLQDPRLWLQQVHPADRAAVIAEDQRTHLTGSHFVQEYRMLTRDEKVIWLRDEGKLVVNEEGIPMIQGVMLDITERKESDLAREGLEHQLRLVQKFEAIGQLAGGIAHDFNNTLMAIIGHSELMLMKMPPDDPLRSSVFEILKASEKSAATVRQLLAFSRRQMMMPEVLDLNRVLTNLDGMIRNLAPKQIEIKYYLADDLGRVKADPSQIVQIIVCLVDNALAAMPQGGCLTLQAENVSLDGAFVKTHKGAVAGSYVMLSVKDTGLGMNEEVQLHLFEPFFTTKEVGKGTGLGLASVYGIVKQSGGYIEMTSSTGSGTTFRIYLPRLNVEVSQLNP